jgi:hypothetical protein
VKSLPAPRLRLRGSHPIVVDSSAVIRTEVEIDPFLEYRNEPPVLVHAEVGTRISQERSLLILSVTKRRPVL